MDKKFLLGGMILVATSMLLAFNANAALSVMVESGGTTTILDSDDGSTDGKINYNSILGGWDISITARGDLFYDNLVPLANFDHMHYDSVNVSGGSGNITLSFIETGLTRTPSSFSTSYGGVFAGTTTFVSYIDGVEVANSGVLSGSAGGAQGGSVSAASPFTWTTVAMIHHDNAGDTTSFNYDVKIPEPSSVALLGLGMIGMGFVARRRRKEG